MDPSKNREDHHNRPQFFAVVVELRWWLIIDFHAILDNTGALFFRSAGSVKIIKKIGEYTDFLPWASEL